MRKLIWGIWLPVSVLILWQLLASAGLLSRLFFPPPSTLLAAAGRMVASGELTRNVSATLARTAAGFLMGSVLGLAVGLLMGGFPRVRQSLEPIVSALNSTPKLSLLPMLMLFVGIGETPRIMLITLGSLIVMSLHALDAVRNIHPAWVELAVNYGAGRRALVRTVYLPACLPQVFTGLRLALGRALVIAVTTEMVSSADGLGSMIWLAWQTFSTDRLYIAFLLIAGFGSLFHLTLRRMERRIVPWKAQSGGS